MYGHYEFVVSDKVNNNIKTPLSVSTSVAIYYTTQALKCTAYLVLIHLFPAVGCSVARDHAWRCAEQQCPRATTLLAPEKSLEMGHHDTQLCQQP